ncbi:TlpA family protein disulfide reductase [Pedobacter sp. MR22-3]|uniref:TlpA family protein disulfide reductase n=1 Tax=Pedobacter sp. MR22-3 TaxID=2994552 RepID=UPI0022481F32|nr:TlpA disulfide reductase family protein [Pedobacter sp. MR22-3]MCX2584338.1 TlpA disulfide reductase family protein [Pedobacter sp. MR22-3]
MKKTIFFIDKALPCLFLWVMKLICLVAEVLKSRPKQTLTFMFCIIVFISNAQQSAKKLSVGDKLPAEFWVKKHQIYFQGKAKQEDLSQFKGRFVILDFWATWCGSCLKKFPLIDSVSVEGGIKFLLVNSITTGDKLDQIKSKLDTVRYPNLQKNVPVIFDDEFLLSSFPNYLLPHYVWIDPSSRIIAITEGDLFTKDSLRTISEKNNKK